MRSLFGRPVFRVGNEQYSWEDVLLASFAWGDWTTLEEDARQGLACLQHLDHSGLSVPDTEVKALATEFRYERDLIAATDLEAWLADWCLEVDEWKAYLRRAVIRRRLTGRLAELSALHPVARSELTPVLHAEAVCSGHLARTARKLAARAAVYDRLAPLPPSDNGARSDHEALQAELERFPTDMDERGLAGLPTDRCRDRMALWARLELALRRFRELVLTPDAISNCVVAHHLDWIGVDYRLLTLPSESTAREAALCAREDGMDLTEIATTAHAPLAEHSCVLGQLDEPLRSRLLGARPREVLGPLPWNGDFALVQLASKRMPSSDDPDVRRRAEHAVLERALEVELQQRVRWLIRL